MTNIEEFIPMGAANRITSREIESLTHMKGAEIRKYVNRARQCGIPICSDDKGYYLAETPYELNRTIAQLKSRINQMQCAINGLNVTLKEMQKQAILQELNIVF